MEFLILYKKICISPLLPKENKVSLLHTDMGSMSWNIQAGKQVALLIPHILLISLFCVFQVSGAQATQCQPLFASNTQQHHPQSGSSNSPSAGWSVEHGADGNLSGRSRRVHGCGGDSGAKPVRSHWWRDSRNGTLPATGTAGGGGGQGELNMGLHYIKLSLQWLTFDFVAF